MMWLQLVVVPWAQQNSIRPLIVWDNFSPHIKVADAILQGQWSPPAELDLSFELLPPNCTKWLQVMDLVVNCTLKSCLRRLRMEHLYHYFQEWRFDYLSKQHLPSSERPQFTPMQIKLVDGVKWFFAACSEAFTSPKFKSGLVRAFYKVGLLRRPHMQYYDVYPLQHPSSYGKWVNELRDVALLPTYEQETSSFYLGDLFDDLLLTNEDACEDSIELVSDDDSDGEAMDMHDDAQSSTQAGNFTFNHCTIGTLNLTTNTNDHN
jgi:hypothetical protein